MTKLDVSCLAVRPTPEMKVRLAAFLRISVNVTERFANT